MAKIKTKKKSVETKVSRVAKEKFLNPEPGDFIRTIRGKKEIGHYATVLKCQGIQKNAGINAYLCLCGTENCFTSILQDEIAEICPGLNKNSHIPSKELLSFYSKDPSKTIKKERKIKK